MHDEQREILIALKENNLSFSHAKKALEKSLKKNDTSSFSAMANKDSAILSTRADKNALEPIAIVGMSGRFPGAKNTAEFWRNLENGVDSVKEIPKNRWDIDRYFDPEPGKAGKMYCRYSGLIDGIDQFDPLFFNISPKEAEEMDPQYRLLLQEIWRAVEDAGYKASDLSAKKVGIFVGGTSGDYQSASVQPPSTECGRIAYLFDWKGPCICIETTCSSGLVALHESCLHLQTGQIDMAVLGSVYLMPTPAAYLGFSKLNALSATGKCFSFDQRADGTIFSESACSLVLKPLSAALSSHDHIYAVIKGTGINYDGKTNGITAPSGKAQTALLADIYQRFNINPEDISMIEAHGTATKLGDPIEANALINTFRKFTDKKSFCALGSVKANIGHTAYASGLVGLSKVLLSLKHKKIPPSINYQTANSSISFEGSPFYVNTDLKDWVSATPRMAAVSSFGFSGTNAHIVVEEYIAEKPQRPAAANPAAKIPTVMIPLSARNRECLQECATNLLFFLQQPVMDSTLKLMDIAYTLQVGREAMKHRIVFVVSTIDQLITELKTFTTKTEKTPHYQSKNCFQDEVKNNHKNEADDDLRRCIKQWILNGQLEKVAKPWVKGADIDWLLFYQEQQPYRLSLPTYPFARERYWLEEENVDYARDSLGVGMESEDLKLQSKPLIPVKNYSEKDWLFIKQGWVANAISDGIDWQQCLRQYQGKNITIVYSDDSEKNEFFQLLEQIEQISSLAEPLKIQPLHIADINQSSFEKVPDIVLFLGPKDNQEQGCQPVEKDLSAVFHLSQCLMKCGYNELVKIYYLYATTADQPRIDCEALSGFLKSAMMENKQHSWHVIGYYEQESNTNKFQCLLQEWLFNYSQNRDDFYEVRYKNSQRLVSTLKEVSLKNAWQSPFKQGGCYVISGGLGPIGELLCEALARRYKATLIILSRGALDNDKQEKCQALRSLGARVYYHCVDISHHSALHTTYTQIKQDVGAINGVIHLARLVEDGLIVSKSWDSFTGVIQAKVQGTLNLDRLTAEEPLDFFMMFSSIAAFGIRGSCDYGYSSQFQNVFSEYRNQLKAQKKRHGISISQCWGAWTVDKYLPKGRNDRLISLGFDLIDMESAFPLLSASCFYQGAAIGLVKAIDLKKLRNRFGLNTELENNKEYPGLIAIEGKIKKWMADKKQGQLISINEINDVVNSEDIKYLCADSIDCLYDLLFIETETKDYSPDSSLMISTPSPSPSPVSKVSANCSEIICESLTEILGLRCDIDEAEFFQNYGMDSISAMRLSAMLEKKLETEVPAKWLIDYPSVQVLSQQLLIQNNT